MKKLNINKAVVFGLARSGVGAANLLAQHGARVVVTDKKPANELSTEGLDSRVELALGGHPEVIFDGCDMVVVSPGIPLDIDPLKKARARNIEVIGELELAYRVFGDSMPFYAVTGTNGKSTTVTLLDLMLKNSGIKTVFGGNIGNAITSELESSAEAQCAVIEVSSFQLEAVDTFKPKGAAILNVTPDHLDRYRSMDEYRRAKEEIFKNQKDDDFLLLNRDDSETMKALDTSIKARIYYFSRFERVKGVYHNDGKIFMNIGVEEKLINADEICIKGVHNLENAMAASAMALLAGASEEAVIETLRSFNGLVHRLEFVREVSGVKYINDSKGTNVGAVLKSIEGFTEPVVLIAGGRDKAGDFALLRPLVKKKVKKVVLIGEASGKIRSALADVTECIQAGSMDEAVSMSRDTALSGDVVLLSPACASFDMFRDFEDRGDKFKDAVRRL